jgi:hypothetical protein
MSRIASVAQHPAGRTEQWSRRQHRRGSLRLVRMNNNEMLRVEEPALEPSRADGLGNTWETGPTSSLVRRVEDLHRRVSRSRVPDFDPDAPLVEGMLGHDRAVLVLHGEVSFSAIPYLEALLDRVIALGIPSLTVDLSDTARTTPDALDAIRRRASQVRSLNVVEGSWP